MKKKSTVLILLLALSLISMIPVLSMTHVDAEPVTYPTTKPGIVDWYIPTGQADYLTLAWNPEYLKMETITPFPSNTTIIVQGKDTYGQNIEAKVVLEGTCTVPIGNEKFFIFNDTHTVPPKPVAFAEITGIFQQNGTHNTRLMIWTEPEPFQEYLGEYHSTGVWLPGKYLWEYPMPPFPETKYLVGHGEGNAATVNDVPVEPSNPDPLKILINWHETDHDLYPDETPLGAAGPAWLWIEGLDEKGNKLEANVTIPLHATEVDVAACHTWSSICKVKGNGTDSYYIFTHPTRERRIFYYTLLIDHITIHPDCYDILANPGVVVNGKYPGATNITVALRDRDGNLIHAAYDKDHPTAGDIVVNFATSGGKIQPSSDVWIRGCHVTAKANLTADTNARTVKVTADANVPECYIGAKLACPHLNLFVWTEVTFDGINSVLYEGWPIHTMQWGYTDASGATRGPFNVPPKPWLPEWLGGPIAGEMSPPYKLDGPIYEVMIPLYVGCNLISSPVHPILCNTYMSGYPITPWPSGIPMNLLFGNTSATTCIEAVWWYCAFASKWYHYVPGVDGAGSYFTDGVGYWIKAEKPCTLEISGVLMENAPFTPSVYPLKANSWNLMGVTSLTGISIKDYLESVNSGDPAYMSAAGPVWVYNAKYGYWARNPSWGLWPTEAFWIYNKVPATLYIAP
jgi:hypothetical protein